MSYSYLSSDLVESKVISNETPKQMWLRLRAEEERLELLKAREENLKPVKTFLTLPMTKDMKYELEKYNRKMRKEERLRRKKKRSRFTSSKQENPETEDSKIEEVISAPPQAPKRKYNPLLDG